MTSGGSGPWPEGNPRRISRGFPLSTGIDAKHRPQWAKADNSGNQLLLQK